MAGDLVLSTESTKGDFQQILDDLKKEILKLQNLDASGKEQLAQDCRVPPLIGLLVCI